MLEAEQYTSYPDLDPVMDSNDGGPAVESSDSELEGCGEISSKGHLQWHMHWGYEFGRWSGTSSLGCALGFLLLALPMLIGNGLLFITPMNPLPIGWDVGPGVLVAFCATISLSNARVATLPEPGVGPTLTHSLFLLSLVSSQMAISPLALPLDLAFSSWLLSPVLNPCQSSC